MTTKKEKDVNKVTELASGEFIRVITSSGESVQISKQDFAKAINEALPLATISSKGLQSNGVRGRVYHGDGGAGCLIIQYTGRVNGATLVKTGTYLNPSLYALIIGQKGGNDAGKPNYFRLKKIVGVNAIKSARIFWRNNKTCIELQLITGCSYSYSVVIDFDNRLESLSVSEDDLYNENSDTDILEGTIE